MIENILKCVLFPKWLEFHCGFNGENPPVVGHKYKDERGNTWIVRKVSKSVLLLSDQEVWDVEIGSISIKAGINFPIKLTRLIDSKEIRSARQKIQDLGIQDVIFNERHLCLCIKNSDVGSIKLPKDVDGIPVYVKYQCTDCKITNSTPAQAYKDKLADFKEASKDKEDFEEWMYNELDDLWWAMTPEERDQLDDQVP